MRSAGGLEPSRRKREGVFYTPEALTRFVVEESLGRTLQERWQAIQERLQPDSERSWREAWEAYREQLMAIRVLDPACGAGVFLATAFDLLLQEHQRTHAALAALRGGPSAPLEPAALILDHSLFGVDLSEEAVELTRLALRLKAAEAGSGATRLSANIHTGNSVVSDPAVDPRAFGWRHGFDVVIGNPPYVRQELIGAMKPHLEERYRSYHGMADLYVYFIEQALSVLEPGGRLGFVITNKWLKAGYAEPLRRLLAAESRLESIVDFGHAPIFPDADAFPSVLTLVKPSQGDEAWAGTLEATQFPREELVNSSIREYVTRHRHRIPQSRLRPEGWGLEPPEVEALLEQFRTVGVPLVSYSGTKPYYGLKTGCNEAFIVDQQTRDSLVAQEAGCAEILKPLLRGEDIDRWAPAWSHLWLLYIPWEFNIRSHPALLRHLERYRPALEGRAEVRQGRLPWYALSRYGADYFHLFGGPKIVYQVIQFYPSYALDVSGHLLNDKGFFIPTADPWLLAVLNSPVMWWHNWRYLTHLKDEALSPIGVKMESLPIAEPPRRARDIAAESVPELVGLTRTNQSALAAVLDSLRLQYGIQSPSQKIAAFPQLQADEFLKEVAKRRPKQLGPLTPRQLQALREVHTEEGGAIRQRQQRALEVERLLADQVHAAYGLTREQLGLMARTAPPRLPGALVATKG